MEVVPPDSPPTLLLTASQLRALEALLPPCLSLGLPAKQAPRALNPPRRSGLSDPISPPYAVSSMKNLPSQSNEGESSKPRLRDCFSLLQRLKKNENSFPFLEPVDPVLLRIPDYFTVIKNPMDLKTVEAKLKEGSYESFEGFEADIKLIVDNAILFNSAEHEVGQMAKRFWEAFERLVKQRNEGSSEAKKPVKSEKKGEIKKKSEKRGEEEQLTYSEKVNLADMIRNKLPQDHFWDLLKIIQQSDTPNEEINIDLEKLPPKIARQLQDFVFSKVKSKSKKKVREEAPKDENKGNNSALTQAQSKDNFRHVSEKSTSKRKESESSNWESSSDEDN